MFQIHLWGTYRIHSIHTYHLCHTNKIHTTHKKSYSKDPYF
jgi:hypothetical protein